MDADPATAMAEFARVICLPRDYKAEACTTCDRPAGFVCDLDAHVIAEIGVQEYERLFEPGSYIP